MKVIRWLLIFAFASPLMAQNVRWDFDVYTVQASGGNLLPVYAIPGAGVQFFSCSGSNCTTLATTYISATSSTTCPTSPTPMQVVLNGTSTCVSSADPYGNMGGWFAPGQYMATIAVSGSNSNYFFTIGGTGGGGGTVNSVTASAPLASSGGANPNISESAATSSTSGYLTSTDWTTFNSKQSALTNPMTGTGSAGQIPVFTGTGGATTPQNVSAAYISAPLLCAGTSGNGAAYACTTSPTMTPTTGTLLELFPDAGSVAGATLTVNGGAPLAISPPVTNSQWNNRSPGQFLEWSPGQCPLCSPYWNQVNVTAQSSNSCTNTGTTTAMVCTSVDPQCSTSQGYVLSLIVPVTNGANPTLQFTCGVSTVTHPITNAAHVAIPSSFLIANGLNSLTIDTSGTGYFVASGTTLPLSLAGGGTSCTTAPCAALGLSQVQVNEGSTRFNTDLTDNASLVTAPAGEQLLQIQTGTSNAVGVVAPISLNVLPPVFDMYYYAPADAPGGGTTLHEQRAGVYNCTLGTGAKAPAWDANLASLDFIPSAATPAPSATCPYQMLAGAQSIMLFYGSLIPNYADGSNQIHNFLSDPNGNGISVTDSRYGQVQVESTSTVGGINYSSDDKLLGNSEYDWSCVSSANVVGVNGHGSQGALFNNGICPPWNATSGSDYIGDLAQLPGNGFNSALKLYAIAISHSRPATQLEKAQAFTYFTNQLAQSGTLGFDDKYAPYLDIHTGDSIMFNAGNGGGFTNSIPFDAAQREPENDQWYNWGVGGKTLCAVVTSIPQNEGAVMPLYPSENKVVRNNGGINDFFAGSTAATVFGCAQNYATNVHAVATDSLVLMGTILPSDEMTITFGQTDTARQTYNADLISGLKAGTLNANGIFDFGGDFEMSTQAIPNVYMATNPALNLSGCAWTSSVATCTIASGSFNGYGCAPGWTYAIAGVSVSGYNGNQGITACTGTTIIFPIGSSLGAGTGGTATPLANGTWYVDGVHPSAKANAELAPEYSFEKISTQGRATKPIGLPYYIDFLAVSAANVASPGTSQTVKLKDLYPGQQVCWVSVNVTTAFAGTGVTGLHMTIGDSGGTTSQYMSSVSLFSTGTTLAPPSGFTSANGTVQMTFTSTGGNLSQMNAGVMTVTPSLVGPGGACPGAASGSAGVSSFSGDGTLLSNSSSTGAVTATLATAGAHKYWGNNTGSTAAPGYDAIATGDLPAIPLSGLATQTANTVVANVTGSTAAPTAAAIPAGIQNYVNGTGYNAATAHQQEGPLLCSDVSGSGTAQSCTTSPSFTPAANDCVIYSTTTQNSGAGLTLNVNSLGAKSVQKWLSTTTLTAGDVPASAPQLACYNGTVWNVYSIGNAPGGGSSALSAITAATGTTTLANGNNPQTWNWAQTTASQYGMTFGETTAKTGAGGGSVLVQTIAGSTGIPLTVQNSLTGTQTLPGLSVPCTWNTSGVVDACIFSNTTNTASGAASLLIDLQVGGVSKFSVDKSGNIVSPASATFAGSTGLTLGTSFTNAGTIKLYTGSAAAGSTTLTITGQSGNFGANIPALTANSAFSMTNTAGGVLNTATQSTVSCSTSGSAIFSEPEQGASDKIVIIHMSACLGTASYTYPVAFTNTPSTYASNNVAASIATSVSTTAVTVTGAPTTGSLRLEDY